MEREQIIRMAREAGFKVDWQHADVAEIKAKRYEHFASLVAAAEREACAKLCDERQEVFQKYYTKGIPALCAESIRARGNT
jgi:hypothetical protein